MILRLPLLSVAIVNVAIPFPSRVTAGDMATPSTRNVTVPVGVPDPGDVGATATVNVTGVPKVTERFDELSLVVVTAKDLTRSDRDRLNGHIQDIVGKAEFNHGRFIGEVQRALSRPAQAIAATVRQ